MGTGRGGRGQQIAGAFLADAGIAHNRLRHPAWLEAPGQIRQLVDDNSRLDGSNHL